MPCELHPLTHDDDRPLGGQYVARFLIDDDLRVVETVQGQKDC